MKKSEKDAIAFKSNCAELMTSMFFQLLVQTVKIENYIYLLDTFSLKSNLKK